jgi:hypothetical protein
MPRLSYAIAQDIRARYAGKESIRPLCHEYGTTPHSIWKIINNITWAPKTCPYCGKPRGQRNKCCPECYKTKPWEKKRSRKSIASSYALAPVWVPHEETRIWGSLWAQHFRDGLNAGILPLGSIWHQGKHKYVVCGNGLEWLEAKKHNYLDKDGQEWNFKPQWVEEI